MKKMSFVFMTMIASFLYGMCLPAQAQDAALLTSTPAAAATVETLRDLFGGPDCVSACWLGITPGMTRDEVEALLEANGVTYEVSEPTMEGGQVTYYVTGGYSHPDVSSEEYPIYIWLTPYDETYRVDGVQLSLKDVSVERMAAAFGGPALIFQYTRQSPPATFEAAYPARGLGFRITNRDQANVVAIAYIMSEDAFLKAYQYNPEFSGVYANCDATWKICAVPTATPAPESLSESAADPTTLRDLVTSPDCASACWLGISVGMSEEAMVAALDANGIPYSIQSMGEGAANYRITGTYKNPAIAPGFVNSIILWVSRGGDTEPANAVTSIDLLLSDMPVSDLIAALGAPTHILAEDGYNGRVGYFVYEGQGLVFTVAYDRVRAVDLLADVTGYINSYPPLERCAPDSQMCVVPTATAVATP